MSASVNLHLYSPCRRRRLAALAAEEPINVGGVWFAFVEDDAGNLCRSEVFQTRNAAMFDKTAIINRQIDECKQRALTPDEIETAGVHGIETEADGTFTAMLLRQYHPPLVVFNSECCLEALIALSNCRIAHAAGLADDEHTLLVMARRCVEEAKALPGAVVGEGNEPVRSWGWSSLLREKES